MCMWIQISIPFYDISGRITGEIVLLNCQGADSSFIFSISTTSFTPLTLSSASSRTSRRQSSPPTDTPTNTTPQTSTSDFPTTRSVSPLLTTSQLTTSPSSTLKSTTLSVSTRFSQFSTISHPLTGKVTVPVTS